MGVSDHRACVRVRGYLPLVPGHELPAHAAPAVMAHLRQCHACQRVLSGYLASDAALREVARAPMVGDEFFRTLEADVVRLAAALPPPARGRRRFLARAAVAAACLVLGLAAAAWLVAGGGSAPGSGLLQQPPLATTPRPAGAGAGERIVPVSFWPSAQGLRGLQKLGRDPRWADGPREGR